MKETISRWLMGVEPYRYYTVSPGEVSPAYGIFHCVFKKGQKATGVFY
jgi:hypothetical protein